MVLPARDGDAESVGLPPLPPLLLGASALVCLLGLAAELARHLVFPGTASPLVPLLSLSVEANLPTWYSSTLLAACGALLCVVAARVRRAGAPFALRWTLLGPVFFYLSLDEAIEIHERLGGLVELRGVLHFSWVVPAAVVVAGLGLAYLPFVRALPPPTRRRFVIAGLLYVGGALGMELPLGWWTERAGDENLVYALLDWVEEALEIFGATLFLLALRDRLRAGEP